MQFVSFHYCITRNTLRSRTFINHFLKQEVVVFAEFLKHICERVNFNEVRGLQPATLVTVNTFTFIFQGFCLIWTNSYLTNTSQWLLLTKNINPADIYLLKVNSRNTRTKVWIMFKVINKATKTAPRRRFGGFFVNFEHISHLCSSVSIINFEHVIAGWEIESRQ